MVPGFMSGFNVIAQTAEESMVKYKTLGKTIIFTVWGSVLFYVLIIVGTAFSADVTTRETATVVVLESLVSLFNGSDLPKMFVAIASLIGMLTSWNAAYIAGSRIFFALGRAKYLPDRFAKLHSKNKTPYFLIILLLVISSFATFLGTSQMIFTSVVNVFGFLLVVAWLIVVISFIRLRKIAPNMNRPYKIKYPKFIGSMAVLSLIFFLFLYPPFNPLGGLTIAELIVLSILIVVTVLGYFKYVHRSPISKEEQRRLLRGEDFENS